MIKAVITAFVLMACVACGAPPPTSPNLEPGFSIVSQQADPETKSVIVVITVTKDATQQQVKTAAESVIASWPYQRREATPLTMCSTIHRAGLSEYRLTDNKTYAETQRRRDK